MSFLSKIYRARSDEELTKILHAASQRAANAPTTTKEAWQRAAAKRRTELAAQQSAATQSLDPRRKELAKLAVELTTLCPKLSLFIPSTLPKELNL